MMILFISIELSQMTHQHLLQSILNTRFIFSLLLLHNLISGLVFLYFFVEKSYSILQLPLFTFQQLFFSNNRLIQIIQLWIMFLILFMQLSFGLFPFPHETFQIPDILFIIFSQHFSFIDWFGPFDTMIPYTISSLLYFFMQFIIGLFMPFIHSFHFSI